jgi:hypothetical protein
MVEGNEVPGLPAVPRFTVQAPEYCSPKSIEFVRARLGRRE